MEKVVKTPTVTFRYPASTKILIQDSPTPILKLTLTLKDLNDFFTKEQPFKSDHALLQRLIYKFNSQLRHFKSFKNLKRINQFMVKYMTLFPEYEEEAALLRECCTQEQGSWFLPSRQMIEYFLAKSMQLSFVLRKMVLFCMNTFQACLSSIHRAELTGAHLVFCSLSSRVWLVARTVILKLVEWYDVLVAWWPHLKGNEADCLNGFSLAGRLQPWLDQKCPVDDDPRQVERKPADADSTLARFMAGEDVLGTGDEAQGQGHDSAESQGDSTESETEVTMAVTRSRKAKFRKTESQAEISRPTTPKEDLGVSIKRKNYLSEPARDSPVTRSPKHRGVEEATSREDLGIAVKRKAFILGEEGRRSSCNSGRNSPRRGPGKSEESTSSDLGIVAKRIAHLQEEGRTSSGRNSPRRGAGKSDESTSRDLGMVARRIADLTEDARAPGRSSPKRSAEKADDDTGVPAKRKKNGENGNIEPKPGTSKKKIKNGTSDDTTNGASESNGTPASTTEPKPGTSNGVFAVPKRRRTTRKPQPGLSKTDFKKTMKTKLKKPARFLEELSHPSLEFGNELYVLPRSSRLKLVHELTVILKQFNTKKKSVPKQPEGQKSQILKQVKKLRLAFKQHARESLWKLLQK